MKPIRSLLILSFSLVLGGCSLTTTTTTTTTTEESVPVEVYTVEDLLAIEATDDVELMADLDLSAEEWVPLFSRDEPYSGVFHGNDHVITGMTITEAHGDVNGLFAAISGTITDLTIRDFSISYATTYVTYAGGLAGMSTATISNVSVDGDISVINTGSSSYVGLLVGESAAQVDSTTTADDFVANMITYSNAVGTILVDSKFFAYVGGLVGKSYNTEFAYNTASSELDVTAQLYRAYVGGLIGHHYGGILIGYEEYVETTDIRIEKNVAISTLAVTSNGTHASIGGLIGYSQYGILSDNFIVTSIDASGLSLYVGSVLGEDWSGNLDTTVGVADFAIQEEDDQTLVVGSVIGFANDAAQNEGCYYAVTSNVEVTQEDGTVATISDLSNEAFYTTSVSWSNEDFDFETLISYLPE